jgi:hypothetical protein
LLDAWKCHRRKPTKSVGKGELSYGTSILRQLGRKQSNALSRCIAERMIGRIVYPRPGQMHPPVSLAELSF